MRDRLRANAQQALILGPHPASLFAEPERLTAALRQAADEVVAAQRSIVEAGAEVIVAPTSKTTAPALHQSGQAYRAAALTAAAVDLSRDAIFASRRPAWVLGEIDAERGAKLLAEAKTHVERLATSAVDGVLIRALDDEAAAEVARTARSHGLATIVEVDVEHAEPMASALGPHSTLLVRGGDVAQLRAALGRVRRTHRDAPLGVRLVAPAGRATNADRERVQRWVASSWDALSQEGLAVVGVEGGHALDALRAIASAWTTGGAEAQSS